MPGDSTTAIKVELSAYRSAYFSGMEKSFTVYRRNNNGPKHFRSRLLTLTSLWLKSPYLVSWHCGIPICEQL